jgi:hypothetical protein
MDALGHDFFQLTNSLGDAFNKRWLMPLRGALSGQRSTQLQAEDVRPVCQGQQPAGSWLGRRGYG